jgi:putative CRISPR-associated protein (TIGR02620 family)
MEKIVVTRYKGLVEYLQELKLIEEETKVVAHANIEDVKGKHVLGVLPLWLSCHAAKITEIQLKLPAEKRGKELTVEEVRFFALSPRTYIVKEVAFNDPVNERKPDK